MLQFEEINEENVDNTNIKSGGANEISLPRIFILSYTDKELTEDAIPEIWEKLNEHYFEGKAENIDFILYFDDLNGKTRIIMALYYSENDFNIPDMNEIANHYGPLFEEFYNKNKPY